MVNPPDSLIFHWLPKKEGRELYKSKKYLFRYQRKLAILIGESKK